MREFLNCDIHTAEGHVREILEEIGQRNPRFLAELQDGEELIYGMELKLTTFCSLSCRDCSHLIPHVPAPEHYAADQMMHCLEKILHAAKIGVLILLGGELFLYPELDRLIGMLRELKSRDRIGVIRVTTNGTMVPSDGFCQAFRKLPFGYGFFSNYSVLSGKQTEAVEKLSSYGIPVQVSPAEGLWRDLGGFHRRDYTRDEVERLYRVCHGKIYLQLFCGHLYHCFRIPVLNEYEMIPHARRDYLDIEHMEQREVDETVLRFYRSSTYMEGCYYCDGSHPASPAIPAAIQTERRGAACCTSAANDERKRKEI